MRYFIPAEQPDDPKFWALHPSWLRPKFYIKRPGEDWDMKPSHFTTAHIETSVQKGVRMECTCPPYGYPEVEP